MTTKEVREKIISSADPDWYNSIEETFNFPYIQYENKIKGVSGIYEFLNNQIEGWDALGTSLPDQLLASRKYFAGIRAQIDSILNSYINQSGSHLNHHWDNNVKGQIRNKSNFPIVYTAPEVDFLLNVKTDNPNSLPAAFNYIVNNNQFNSNDKNSFLGMLLAYEFTSKGKAGITNRIKAETRSLDQLKNNFQTYINDSETQLVKHLDNSNRSYIDYVNSMDILKSDKDALFETWFKDTKANFVEFDTDSKRKTKELENAYEELLRLNKPAEYWKLRGAELKEDGWKFLKWLIGLVLFACVVLYSLLWLTPEDMLKSFFNNDRTIAVRWSIIFITLISFLAYGIRALTKVTFSSFHLARDAEERERLTYVYLAMIKDSSVDKEDRHLIMQSLFSRADTGLLKEDSSPTMPGIGGVIERTLK